MRCLFCKSFTKNNRPCKRCSAFNSAPAYPGSRMRGLDDAPLISTTSAVGQLAIKSGSVYA